MTAILVLSGLVIEAGCLALAAMARGGQGRTVLPFLAVMLVMGAAYLRAAWTAARDGAGDAPGPGLILTFAALFYLTLLPGEPLFDDDLYRYLWDGRVTLAGINPYLHSPDDPELAVLRDGLHQRIGYPHLPTPYPPAAQALFAAMRLISGGRILPAKVFLGLFFLGSVWLTARLLALTGGQPRLVLLYAWNPVVLKEFANSGHLEPAAIFFLLLAVHLLIRKREALSGAALAVASLVKLFPLFAVPFFLVRSRRRGRWLLAFGAVALTLYLPFLTAGSGVLGSLGVYLRNWLFNQGPYGLWQRLVGLLAGEAGGRWARGLFWPLALGAGILAAWRTRRGSDGVAHRALGSYLFTLVVFSPTVMPWYLTWGLPLLCYRPSLAAHGFSVLSSLSYVYYLGRRDIPWVRGLEYAALALFICLDRVGRRKENPSP